MIENIVTSRRAKGVTATAVVTPRITVREARQHNFKNEARQHNLKNIDPLHALRHA
ncbi:MAG TPA: hypothetical protein VGF59_27980 [Bryobacteraceae bacterium]|jgi:hypothetical protein